MFPKSTLRRGLLPVVALVVLAVTASSAGAARHASWYLRHQVYGVARSDSDSAEDKRPGRAFLDSLDQLS